GAERGECAVLDQDGAVEGLALDGDDMGVGDGEQRHASTLRRGDGGVKSAEAQAGDRARRYPSHMATTKKAKSGSTKKEAKSKDVKGKDRKSKDLKRKDAKKKDAKKKDTKKKDTKKKSGKKGTSKKSSASKPAVTTETAALRIPSAEQTPTAFRLG